MSFRYAVVRIRVLRSLIGLGVLFLWGSVPDVRSQQPVDLILHNGKILTVDDSFSTAQAVAVTGNTITAVGNNADILKLSAPGTQVIDLRGRTVTPGMIDTHRHYSVDGMIASEKDRNSYRVDWKAVKTKEDVLNQIAGIIQREKIPPGAWIHFDNDVGFMGAVSPTTVLYSKILFDELNRWELDKAAPSNPIIMSLGVPEYSQILVNGVAMDILWKEYGDFIKENGRYWIDSSGRPDGHLESPAQRPIQQVYEPRPTAEVQAPHFRKIQEAEAAIGLTVVSGRYPTYRVKSLQLLESRGQLIQRVAYGYEDVFGVIKDLGELKNLASKIGSGTDKIWINSIAPSNVDGAGGRVCSSQPKQGLYATDYVYPMGACQLDTEYRGPGQRAAPLQANYFRDWLQASGRYGVRFANTHVSGDRSYSILLATMEQIQKQYGPDATRNWALDHCDMVNPADLPLAGKLGATFSCYSSPIERGAGIAASYGEEVAQKFISPVKSMLNAGAKVVFEMDSDANVWQALERLITRKDSKGKVWGPQERVDRTTALKMITRWAADYLLRGDKLGSIEAGKLADLVVLNRDYMTIPEEEIRGLQSRFTVLGGKIIYVHPDFAQEYNLRPAGAVVSTYDELKARRNPLRDYSGGQG
ncbi:MAG: hypothetical protein A3H27_02295 [Acidobacteria bacterium RIFCSPLOWO2_02_FULL_59_13]|nr:MAG: hypothetical protein A3H27_02295 [Acidobacteria bacterium RIFCSPLOWO2_02_FULL_59_13]